MIRDYKYIEHTTSICSVCNRKIDGKIVEKEGSVFILKNCPVHGSFTELLEEDALYYRNRTLYDKPGNECICQTSRQDGCPFDCGLCPEHEQHTCVALIEITSGCNLNCPVCFANSGKADYLPYESFNRMLDFYVESEGGKADILQISGGEPTLHPEIISFIQLARTKHIGYVMLNTNGIRIAEDIDFVEELSQFKGGFEVYLQFDGFNESTHSYFRGKPLSLVKQKAIENLKKFDIPITLVVTVEQGVNDQELGKIVGLGLSDRSIRGINFQPIAYFGRLPEVKVHNRITLTSILNKIEMQTSRMIRKSDFIPLPCNVDRAAITYFFRDKHKDFIPVTRNMDMQQYLPFIKNTFKFDPDDFLKGFSDTMFAKECCNRAGLFKEFSKFIPLNYVFKTEKEKIRYVSENTFRLSVTSFVDTYNFDIKSVQKECVHFITPDLKKIPFSTYNMFHRK